MRKMEEKSEVKKEEERIKPQIMAMEKPPRFATGISIAAGRGEIIISFLFSPPEDERRVYVISRVILPVEVADRLAKVLNETLDKLREITSKEREREDLKSVSK